MTAWFYANVEKTIVSDGLNSIPLDQPTGESRRLKMLIEGGMPIADYQAPIAAAAKPTYTLDMLASALVAKGIVPPADEAYAAAALK